eukprot:CCRYP_004929-RA/>CCRYP_004929-RA protein AED:0.00 eAED:0.00 QI:1605/1/1/1/0/0/2/1994/99
MHSDTTLNNYSGLFDCPTIRRNSSAKKSAAHALDGQSSMTPDRPSQKGMQPPILHPCFDSGINQVFHQPRPSSSFVSPAQAGLCYRTLLPISKHRPEKT